MSMLEKIARAIAPHAYESDDPDAPLSIIATQAQWREWADKRARAVVEALREPTQEMEDAADETGSLFQEGDDVCPSGDNDAKIVWQAMIDAILK